MVPPKFEQHPALVAADRQAERAAGLAVARSTSIQRSATARSASRRKGGEKVPNAVGDRACGLVPRGGRRRRVADRGEEVPPGSSAVGVAEQAGLGRQVATEVGERGDDGALHGLEHRPLHGVGEEGGLEIVGPAPAPVERRALPLHAVEAGGERDGDRVPRRQLGLVGPLAHAGVGIEGEVAHGGDRQLVAVDLGGEPGGDVAVQPVPGRAARQVELGGEGLLGLAELVVAAIGRPANDVGVVGGGGGCRRGGRRCRSWPARRRGAVRRGPSGAVRARSSEAIDWASSSRASVVTKPCT